MRDNLSRFIIARSASSIVLFLPAQYLVMFHDFSMAMAWTRPRPFFLALDDLDDTPPCALAGCSWAGFLLD